MCIRDRYVAKTLRKRGRAEIDRRFPAADVLLSETLAQSYGCLLYTSDAADERSSVDLGGRRIIKKKKKIRDMQVRRSLECTTT